MAKQVYLKTINLRPCKSCPDLELISGPFDRDMLEKWIDHKHRECAEGILEWEILDEHPNG